MKTGWSEKQKHHQEVEEKHLYALGAVSFGLILHFRNDFASPLQVVVEVLRQLEGAYALIFKSSHYPNEIVACKRGSPMLLGVKVSRSWERSSA
jgi:glucosamine 6-phosphate synthetase-like amidotransferase/phosphosugar isomerase protein